MVHPAMESGVCRGQFAIFREGLKVRRDAAAAARPGIILICEAQRGRTL